MKVATRRQTALTGCMNIHTMRAMIESSYKRMGGALAASSVLNLRRAAGADEVSKTDLAGRVGMSRQTMSARLNLGDMKLSEFIAASLALGRRPSDLMDAAEDALDATSIPAPADPNPTEAGVES